MITATEIKLRRAENRLEITFDDGSTANLSAEYLRVESPSAEVQGHGPAQKQLVSGKRNVSITGIEPTGNYAIRLIFSDGHDTGIYSWDILHRLGQDFARLWPAYLQNLAQSGLERG